MDQMAKMMLKNHLNLLMEAEKAETTMDRVMKTKMVKTSSELLPLPITTVVRDKVTILSTTEGTLVDLKSMACKEVH